MLAPNIPAMYEAHFGVPMAQAVLNTINIRLDAAAIGFILDHAAPAIAMEHWQGPQVLRVLPHVPGKRIPERVEIGATMMGDVVS